VTDRFTYLVGIYLFLFHYSSSAGSTLFVFRYRNIFGFARSVLTFAGDVIGFGLSTSSFPASFARMNS